jgi:hypothetical protein
MGKKINAFTTWKSKPERKRALVRPRPTWGDDIEMDVKEMGCEGLNWTDMTWITTSGCLL